VTSGLLATLAVSALARTAIRYGVTALAILLFLLALRRSGERAGRLAGWPSSLTTRREAISFNAGCSKRRRDGHF
jgi:hypothetical protein